jgi:protein O-GlcNAc transferase
MNPSGNVNNHQNMEESFSNEIKNNEGLISELLINDRFDEAIELCLIYLEEYPSNKSIQLKLLLSFLLSNHEEEFQELLFEIIFQENLSEVINCDEGIQSFLKKESLQRINDGKLAQAERLLFCLIEINNQDDWAYQQIGNVYLKGEVFEDAILAYQKVLSIKPNHVESLFNLGIALNSLNRLDEAADCFKKLTAQGVYLKDSYYNLGQIYGAKEGSIIGSFYHGLYLAFNNEYEEAERLLELVVGSEFETEQLYWILYEIYRRSGKNDESLKIITRGARKYENSSILRFKQKLAVPLLYENEAEIYFYRERFTQEMQELTSQKIVNNTPDEIKQLVDALGNHNNFFLSYQGYNDLSLQEKYGCFVHKIMNYGIKDSENILSIRNKNDSKRIKIGYASYCFFGHTVCKLFQGWIKYANVEEFEIFVYHFGETYDSYTRNIESYCEHFYHLPFRFDDAYKQILKDQLDILIYPEIGMDNKTIKLAALKLAPVQCMAWGHPVTSGLPNIDYFLSSELMEPENATDHYSEKLIKLPHIGIAYEMPIIPSNPLTRDDFKIRPDSVVYLSCQSIFKYLPQYDFIFVDIAKRVPNAQFVFISPQSLALANKFQHRMRRAFAAYNLSFDDYCIMVPQQDTIGYFSLNLVSNIFLDTLSWSGGNTTLEALACDLPIVTYPGEYMRGRHSYAMLRRIGIDETIATSFESYIDIAVQLGIDINFRKNLVRKIAKNKNLLFNDTICINHLEIFFKELVSSK